MPVNGLPTGWRWVKLSEVAEINPRRPSGFQRAGNARTTFVPMAAVGARLGAIADLQARPYADVAKGYTYFADGDVLFAKITPCMQNGKHAIAEGLIDGVGFASTEFHVIRPGPALDPRWVHAFIRQPSVLDKATGFFSGAVGQQRVPDDFLRNLGIPLPPLAEQQRIAGTLQDQLATVERARAAAETQLSELENLINSYIRNSVKSGKALRVRLGDCLTEVRKGIGYSWTNYPLIGATRDGIAPAKERIGKNPEKYKLVDHGTVFYNPMRIIIGSIAMVDEGDVAGITSPDYVVLKGKPGIVDSRWFYYWFRSPYGNNLVDSLSRGAVRERILFNRLGAGEIELPSFSFQQAVSFKLKAIRHIRAIISQKLNAICALPSNFLRQAFDGGS